MYVYVCINVLNEIAIAAICLCIHMLFHSRCTVLRMKSVYAYISVIRTYVFITDTLQKHLHVFTCWTAEGRY